MSRRAAQSGGLPSGGRALTPGAGGSFLETAALLPETGRVDGSWGWSGEGEPERLRHELRSCEARLDEVVHRVKNNLQLVASLLSLQAARSDQPEVVRALEAARSRVLAMTRVHERLYAREGGGPPSMRELVASLVQAHGGGPMSIETRVEEVALAPGAVVPLSMIVNELVSNAVQHAHAPGRAGRITVSLRARPDAVELVVGDDGRGLDPAAPRGIGLRLVELWVEQLGGRLTVERAGGARLSVLVPNGAST